jgi:hypothetical protein
MNAAREIDKTPGRLIVAALICFYSGIVIGTLGMFLFPIGNGVLSVSLLGFMWFPMTAALFLIFATIFACFDNKPEAGR